MLNSSKSGSYSLLLSGLRKASAVLGKINDRHHMYSLRCAHRRDACSIHAELHSKYTAHNFKPQRQSKDNVHNCSNNQLQQFEIKNLKIRR